MKLEDLIGSHELSGIDETSEEMGGWNHDESVSVILFILDDITYKAVEDPDDGYRSYMKELVRCDDKVSNVFPPQKVFGKMKGSEEWCVNATIQFFDSETTKLVLELGTDNTDDYYPYCVMHWHPENLSINRETKC